MNRMPFIPFRESSKNCIWLNWLSYKKCKIRHKALRDLASFACYYGHGILFYYCYVAKLSKLHSSRKCK